MMIQRAHFRPNGEGTGAKDAKLDFEFPHEIEVFLGGTVGETFSYFGEIEIEHEEELEYEFWLQYDYRPH